MSLSSASATDAVLLLLLLGACLAFFIGKARNRRLALRTAASLQRTLSSQFALTGPAAFDPPLRSPSPDGSDPSGWLLAEAFHRYKLYATGRRHCRGALVSLAFVPRQDLLSLALGALGLVALAEDAVVVDIAVDAAVAGKALLVVVRRRRERRYRRRHADVAALGDEAMALTDELVVVSDVPEVKEVLLGKKEMRVVRENEALLECVHVSDRFEAAADEEPALDKELVRVRMKAPRSEVEFAALVELVEMACGLVDRLAALRLQGEARRVSEKKRAAMLEMENRAKREEKRREEQEAVREKEVTPEEMKRREERRRRKKGVAKVAILR